MKIKSLVLLFFIFCTQHGTAQELKSPSEFLGYELGSQFSRHADVVNYFKHIAEKSNLVTYSEYGHTNERRPLTYAVISSEENLKNIEQIQENHLNSLEAESSGQEIAIVWLSYNVHGNEASSTEAAMATLHELVTTKQEWLKNTVIIIDPCLNPDGRDRYVNWYNQVKAAPYSTNRAAVEHQEPWPGGRPNHYLFDLNRDWAWATQVETRARLKIYNQWMPHIHVDFHEQFINSPYYFAPAAEPLHEAITPFQREFQTKIGKNHAKYFDKEGWLYFTKEVFDLLYPSYGDTYPTYSGAIGMTYEQAGHGLAGLGIENDEGITLTLKDRLQHHLTSGLSTVEVASKNAAELNKSFQNYFRNKDFEYKTYVLSGNHDKLEALTKLLDRHEIEYDYGNGSKVSGYSYSDSKNASKNADENSLIISANQPKATMVKVLFEPETRLPDSLTYDITAWSLPYAYGLDGIATSNTIEATGNSPEEFIYGIKDHTAMAYIAKWESMKDARFLARLLKSGFKVRFSEKEFTNAGEDFGRGSFIITKGDNQSKENFVDSLYSIANDSERRIFPTPTGFSTKGPDFGSSSMNYLEQPKIALLRSDNSSSLNFGEIWYYFEQDLNYPVMPIHAENFERLDLSEIDVLILPSGSYASVFDKTGMDKLKNWVRSGGKVISIGAAINTFSNDNDFSIKGKKATSNDSVKSADLTPYADRERESISENITGSIFRTKVDNTHPLAFGYGQEYFTLKLSNESYELLTDGYNVAYMQNPERIAGFAGSKTLKNLENSLVFGVERMGSGSIIYFVDNPLFRAFWENGKLFFANAVFYN